MKVLYHGNIGNGESKEGYEKLIEVNVITFFPESKEIQVGSRYYQIPADGVDFNDLMNGIIDDGFFDATGYEYKVASENKYNHYNNKGGYSRGYSSYNQKNGGRRRY